MEEHKLYLKCYWESMLGVKWDNFRTWAVFLLTKVRTAHACCCVIWLISAKRRCITYSMYIEIVPWLIYRAPGTALCDGAANGDFDSHRTVNHRSEYSHHPVLSIRAWRNINTREQLLLIMVETLCFVSRSENVWWYLNSSSMLVLLAL